MLKSIIKEIIIILLLLIAVLLVLGILFYDYLPNMKEVPTVKKYSTAENIKNDLAEVVQNENETYATFTITAGDISNYTKTNTYVARNDNPFTKYKSPEEADTSGNTAVQQPGGNSSGNTNGGNSSSGNNGKTGTNSIK